MGDERFRGLPDLQWRLWSSRVVPRAGGAPGTRANEQEFCTRFTVIGRYASLCESLEDDLGVLMPLIRAHPHL